MLFFLPLAALWLLWQRRTVGRGRSSSWSSLLCVAPWTIRNHRVYGRWIAVASEGGVTFWTGNHPLARGDGDLAANLDIKRAELAFRAAHPGLTPEADGAALLPGCAARGSGGEPAAWLALRRAQGVLHGGAGRPVVCATLGEISRRVRRVVPADPARGDRGRVAMARRRGARASPAALWLMAAATVAAGLVFFPQERFRIPVIDPALIVTAALPAGLRKR